MIGNDVIDLHLASQESNWQRRGFLDKVFTKSEQSFIAKAENSFQTVWLLWSMKESAYKAFLQENPQRFFNPKKLECSLKNKTHGTVQIGTKEYQTISQITKNYIHTVAVCNQDTSLTTASFRLGTSDYPTQHKEVYKKLCSQVSHLKKIPQSTVNIKKCDSAIPTVYYNNKPLNTSFSLSHHGNYGAYAILN